MSDPYTQPSPAAISRARAWYIVGVLTVANVSGFVDRQILSVLVEPLKRDLGITDTQVSLLMGTSFVLFYSLLGLPIGRWVDRGVRKVIVALGVAAWSVMTLASGFARTFSTLFAARVGVGVGEATLGPAAVSLIADAFPRRLLGSAMSVYMLGTFLGSGVAYMLAGWVVSSLDRPGFTTLPIVGEIHPWQTVFFIVGLPGFLIAALALTMREPPRTADPSDGAPLPAGASAMESPAPTSSGAVPSLAETIAYVRRNLWTIASITLAFSCWASVNYGIAFWLVTFLGRTHGWSVAESALLQGALTATIGSLGSLLGGWLTDRWARGGIVDAPLRVGVAGGIGMLICAVAYPLVPTGAVAAALLVPLNVFAALPWGAANAAIAQALPARMRGQGSALYQLVLNLVSGVLGPTSVAVLTDVVFGNPNAIRYSLALCAAVGMTLAVTLLQSGRAAFRRTVAAL